MSINQSFRPASISGIEQALTFIDPTGRDTWISCGMAIKSEVGESGFDIWDKWSAGADNYQARAAKSSWKGFSEGGGITIKTLFKLAIDNGYVRNTSDEPAPLTPEQIAQREAKRLAVDAEQGKRRADAAAKVTGIWNAKMSALEACCPAVSEHQYLVNKGIQAHGAKVYRGSLTIGGMDCNGALMLPMKLNGNISSLQFINQAGVKRFLPDGQKGGFLIGKIQADMPICVCEGFATAASIHEATGYPVVVAFDAGNLKKMAVALRTKNPTVKIVICADDDESGTGKRKAIEAAQAVGGLLAMPVFPAETDKSKLTDFNDMSKLSGADSVKAAIDAAVPVIPKTVSPVCVVDNPKLTDKPNKPLGPPEPLPTLPAVLAFVRISLNVTGCFGLS